MTDAFDLLWKPLLEASAQTITGAIGGYAFSKALEKLLERNRFDGPMDFWRRGIAGGLIHDGDQVYIDGLISPYFQLFPGDPFDNGKRWNKLYDFEGTINSEEYQALDFLCGSDAALRLGSLNGETVLGIFARYGYVGDGLVGVAPTSLIRKKFPDFFHPKYYGSRAVIGGKISRCPTQHAVIAKSIASRLDPNKEFSVDYKHLYYLQINSIRLFNRESDKTCSLIGSPWALTDNRSEQYLVQYGYFNDPTELEGCISKIKGAPSWSEAQVFFDDITAPSESLGFKKAFIL
ncbi:hypothetical protein MTBLM5_10109 [Magnetospirillum sp. LM-5]|uniref:hypothetical protein n=1 Tax=Magnetospirillum sp. LM-5 TaxID=2681466 RepID=UPI00137FB9D5|nr:hypothetical protein [Magnetospirillum sp. LM-5]CAA7611567.1 hypothetical protein MTBLM5_10109 [Magnetospirillum sp. LM-5]